jgi:hypothetical protein
MLHTEPSDSMMSVPLSFEQEFFMPESPRLWQGSVDQILQMLEDVEAEKPSPGTRVIVGERGDRYVPHTIIFSNVQLRLSDHAIPDVSIEATEGNRIRVSKRQLKGAIEYLLAMRQASKQ